MTTRKEKKLQTRKAFFEAVLKLCMAGQSFSSISLRQVTREVGVVPTAFYRHFEDMEALGSALVRDELGTALVKLREHMHLGKTRSFDRQVAKSVQLFFTAIETHPEYWHFMASERFGGSESVREAINEQTELFINILGADLKLQPQFGHISDFDLKLLAEMGVNLSFTWMISWLELSYNAEHSDDTKKANIEFQKKEMLHRFTRQTQMLFYGAYNWQSTEET